MARIEVTEQSLRAAVDEGVFGQALDLTEKVGGLSAAGLQVEAVVAGAAVSVQIRPDGIEAHCECPAPAPCPHAVAAALAWVRAGAEEAEEAEEDAVQPFPGLVAGLRAEFDEVLGELADEARECGPGDEWYPYTDDLEELLDELEDLAAETPDVVRQLTEYVIERIKAVLAYGKDQGDDLADALAHAEGLRQEGLRQEGLRQEDLRQEDLRQDA